MKAHSVRLCGDVPEDNDQRLVAWRKRYKRDMCFTCVTGETDASDDYELIAK